MISQPTVKIAINRALSDNGVPLEVLQDLTDIGALTFEILEDKSISSFTKANKERDKETSDLADVKGLSNIRSRDTKVASKSFNELSKRLSDDLKKAVQSYYMAQKGMAPKVFGPDTPQTKTALNKRMKKLFKDAYLNTFLLGVEASGIKKVTDNIDLTTDEKKWVQSAYSEEMKHFKKLFSDIIAGDPESIDTRTKLFKRINNYVLSLKSVFASGKVIASPPNVLTYWVLHPAEHCPDCILLNKYSPYTKENLPTTPRAGDTQCLFNCKCSLRMVTASPTKVAQIAAKNKKDKNKLRHLKVKSR